MIRGVGTDIIEISRIENAKDSFFKSVFTINELSRFHGHNYNSLAGIFSAKEAVAKALGTGFMGFGPKEIEILQNEKGKPYCRLYNGAADRLSQIGGKNIYISISHSKENAIAFAVIE